MNLFAVAREQGIESLACEFSLGQALAHTRSWGLLKQPSPSFLGSPSHLLPLARLMWPWISAWVRQDS